LTKYYHPSCFNIPRKLSTGSHKVTPADFVADYLDDHSPSHEILPAQQDALVEAIASKDIAGAATGGEAKASGGTNTESLVGRIRQRYQDEMQGGGGSGPSGKKKGSAAQTSPPRKKLKQENASAASAVAAVSPEAVSSNSADAIEERQLATYEQYHTCKSAELSMILEWNRQQKSGTKDVLLNRLLDGVAFGRLAFCPLCSTGRLKLSDDGGTATCNGTFNEDIQRRIDCLYKAPAAQAPRFLPW
jgi:hypothetical protein